MMKSPINPEIEAEFRDTANNFILRRARAETLFALGEIHLALDDIHRSLSAMPDNAARPGYRVAAARLFSQHGDHQTALSQLGTALRESPDHPEILLELARVNRDAGNLRRALQMATRAGEAGFAGGKPPRPHLPGLADSRAWAEGPWLLITELESALGDREASRLAANLAEEARTFRLGHR